MQFMYLYVFVDGRNYSVFHYGSSRCVFDLLSNRIVLVLFVHHRVRYYSSWVRPDQTLLYVPLELPAYLITCRPWCRGTGSVLAAAAPLERALACASIAAKHRYKATK
jgi:hypothetical protein